MRVGGLRVCVGRGQLAFSLRFPGRPLNEVGAHCKGHNAHSIGICYIGGLTADGKQPKDTRTPSQRIALEALVLLLRLRFPRATVHGHREFAAKACPCFEVKDEF